MSCGVLEYLNVPGPDLSSLTTTMGLQRHYWAVWMLCAVLTLMCEARETVQDAGMRFLLDLTASMGIEETFYSPFSSKFGRFERLECNSGDCFSS
jgi:hypothetical protein